MLIKISQFFVFLQSKTIFVLFNVVLLISDDIWMYFELHHRSSFPRNDYQFLLRSSLSCQPKNMEKPVFALQSTAAIKINKQPKISCRWAFCLTIYVQCTAHCANNKFKTVLFYIILLSMNIIQFIELLWWYWIKLTILLLSF